MLDYGLLFRTFGTFLVFIIWLVGIKLSKFQGFVYLAAKEFLTLLVRAIMLFELLEGNLLSQAFCIETTINVIFNILASFAFVNAWIQASHRTWKECLMNLFKH